MLTGQEPFRGDDVASLLYQVVHENPPPISQFVPPTWDPAPLQAVLDRALAKDPERRWGGMMELARAFEDAAERTICQPRPRAATVSLTGSQRCGRAGCAPAGASPAAVAAGDAAAVQPAVAAAPFACTAAPAAITQRHLDCAT